MIKHKEKYETPYFTFWIYKHTKDSSCEYDITLASEYVAPSASKNDLQGLVDFINNFLENDNDSSTTS